MNAQRPTRRGDWMQTYTGRQFWPLDPRPSEIDITDIAHSLGMACRYAGHVLQFYSVAEHCVLLCRWLESCGEPAEVQLAGLLHDATEAYLVDVPRPVKPHLSEYRKFETRLWYAVAARFNISAHVPDIVHFADSAILADEQRQNMAPCSVQWDLPYGALDIELQFWSPARAKAEFLAEFERLTGGLQ